MDISAFVAERNRILRSLDETAIRRYMRKYRIPVASDPIVFWGGVYKALTGIRDIPDDERQWAVDWLQSHEMRPL